MQNLIAASTSTLYNQEYLEYLLPELKLLFKDCAELLFIPYARPNGISHESYTQKVENTFKTINIKVKGIHEFEDKKKAIINAKAIFVGGGNTFLLVAQLYHHQIMTTLSDSIKMGTPFLGTSAGSNILGLTMQNTNDMPIIYPPNFKTLGILPFNINPHYFESSETTSHMGETREMRINEYHQFNSIPVIGLREGSWIEIKGDKILLKGNLQARVFRQHKIPIEVNPGIDLSELD